MSRTIDWSARTESAWPSLLLQRWTATRIL